MMFEVVQSEAFLTSLVDCASYIKDKLNNPVAANHMVDRTEQAALSLTDMPHRFPYSRYHSLAEKGIRVLPIGNHCVFYSVDDTTQTVYLHLFGYGARDWETLF